ncbi:DUF2971 domain-containing protein [Draconibacterium mangrovi]|uniref:DUF2971 domain-containing protein n=1 Tax=Draconibacterium mangrovi TaxID=2697469 RepID=UPI0013D36D3E|nr:DUF2971 domain-containing protein [Draconibacterium mangrovi]
MTEKVCYISNKGKENQRIHTSRVSASHILNKIEYPKETVPPKNLLKFYSITQNSVDALIKNYLFSANPLSFNDPFDCPVQVWDEMIFSQETMLNSVNPLFKSIWQNDNNINKENFFNFFFGFIGIICLNNPAYENQDLMWGYYTNQQGFAISFKSSELLKIWHQPFLVEYLEKDKLDKFSADSIATRNIIDLFPRIIRWSTQKDNKWDKENEWRFVFLDCLIDPLTFKPKIEDRKKNYTPESIEEILLGNRFFDSQYSVYQNREQFLYLTNEKTKLQNELLSYLAFPNSIKVRHLFMKKEELYLYPRECRIWRQDKERFRIEYLE